MAFFRRVILVVALLALTFVHASLLSSSTEFLEEFQLFQKRFNKKYTTTTTTVGEENEHQRRFAIFQRNMRKAKRLELENPGASFGWRSPFADLTEEEYAGKMLVRGGGRGGEQIDGNRETKHYTEAELSPESGKFVDWRTKGAITQVFCQGECASGYSFASMDSASAQWVIVKRRELHRLSAQFAVSCVTTAYHCAGGTPTEVYTWLVENTDGQWASEQSYPYASREGDVPKCNLTNRVEPVQIRGHQYIGVRNEQIMANHVFNNGPLVVPVDANDWPLYTGGILKKCSQGVPNQSALLVGFNDTHQPPYWIVKNSFGNDYGIEGYLHIEKGINACNMTFRPSTALV